MIQRMVIYSAMGIILVATVCCKPTVESSHVKYSYYPATTTYQGIGGRIDSLNLGISSNFSKVIVCVGLGTDTYPSKNFLLETKLAYAMWMKASNHFVASDWQYMEFKQQAHCDRSNPSYGSYVFIADANEGSPLHHKFKPKTLTCSRPNGKPSCQPRAGVLGFGSVGEIEVKQTSDQGGTLGISKPLITSLAPAQTELSFEVNWETIPKNLMKNKTQGSYFVATAITEYEKLLAVKNPSYSDFDGLIDALTVYKMMGTLEADSQARFNLFFDSGLTAKTYVFQPVYIAFWAILHEVGHQFGMTHAHKPEKGTIVGSAAEIHGEAKNTVFTTNVAAMAYEKVYLYLTADDRAGMEMLSLDIFNYMKSLRQEQRDEQEQQQQK